MQRSWFCLECAIADVAAEIDAFKLDFGEGLIGAGEGFAERISLGGGAEDAAPACDELAADPRRAGVKDLDAWNLGGVAEAGEGEAGFVAGGVPGRTGYYACGGAGAPAQRGLVEAAFDAGFEGVEQVGLEAGQDDLGFRIAEAGVVFEDFGTARGHHEAAIEDADEGRAFFGHAADGGLGDVAHDPLGHLRLEHGVSGVGAHAAGVEAGVVFADALVVLCREKRGDVGAVTETNEADFFALEEFLDDNLLRGFAEERAVEEAVGGFEGDVARLAEDDAFAGGEAVGFDDDGRMEEGDGFFELAGVRTDRVFGGGDLMALHELLSEGLAGLEARGGLGGAEDAEAAGLEGVDDAEGERQLGADDGEAGGFGCDEADHVVESFEVDGDAAGDLSDAAVAGRADNFRDTRAACDGPGKRVFAAP